MEVGPVLVTGVDDNFEALVTDSCLHSKSHQQNNSRTNITIIKLSLSHQHHWTLNIDITFTCIFRNTTETLKITVPQISIIHKGWILKWGLQTISALDEFFSCQLAHNLTVAITREREKSLLNVVNIKCVILMVHPRLELFWDGFRCILGPWAWFFGWTHYIFQINV